MKIEEVKTKKQLNDFLLLPWNIYATDKFWIPPLLITVKQALDDKKNPFYKHAKLRLWTAYQDNKCVGRIAGIIDDNHNNFHNEKTGFWGFFECINDQTVCNALFKEVESWVRSQAMTVLRGPVSPSTNYECGLQISAFDTKPFIMMTQNPEYYPALVEKAGFAKAKDLLAWVVDNSVEFDPRLIRHAERTMQSKNVTIRSMNKKKWDEEIAIIKEIYNSAWEKNWGFVPITDDEFHQLAKDMKQIVIPDLILIVEVKGKPAGFGVLLPDMNQVMEKIPDGKLFPTGLFKLLWYTKVKNVVNRGRIPMLAVKREYRYLGLAALMYLTYFKIGPEKGFPVAECSWILEDNSAMNDGLKFMKAKHYKTYRIYDKPLGAGQQI